MIHVDYKGNFKWGPEDLLGLLMAPSAVFAESEFLSLSLSYSSFLQHDSIIRVPS